MRVIFMGTPEFAVPTLAALHDAGHTIVAAYTQPPRRAGRGKKVQPSPVQIEAERRHIPVRHPVTLRDEQVRADLAALEADIAVVAAYGLILPQAVLDMPRLGCVNVHASLLPRWRGAAPVQRAILAGDAVTGITIMQMEAGLDTGPMLATARVQTDRKAAGALTEELAQVGAQLLVGTLIDIEALRAVEQDEEQATYAAKIDKAEAQLDFSRAAEALERQIRAFAPFPGAWFTLDGERIKVLEAAVLGLEGKPGHTLDDDLTIACGHAALRPTKVQRAGKPVMDVDAFLRGKAVPAGVLLG